MSTFQDLITIIREDYLSDTFDGYDTATQAERDANVLWKDSQLLRYLVEAQEEACLRADLIPTNDTALALSAGTRTYDINPIMIRIDKVLYGDKVLKHVSKQTLEENHPNWRTMTGLSYSGEIYYFMTGFKLNIFPLPDATDIASNSTLVLEGYRMPEDGLLISDELEIPLYMHKNVIWYALHNCYQLNDADALNYKESQLYYNKFDQAFGPKLDNRVIIHQLEEPHEDGYLGPINYMGSTSATDDEWHN